MSAPEHVRQSAVQEKTTDVGGTLDRLHDETVETALYLSEGDFAAAVKHAYRAAWFWQKLPAPEQERYVETELVEDAGPVDTGDEWAGAAFVAWLVYRCNRLATAYGRDLSALGERAEQRAISVPIAAPRSPEAPESYARPMFAGFADVAAGHTKGRLQS